MKSLLFFALLGVLNFSQSACTVGGDKGSKQSAPNEIGIGALPTGIQAYTTVNYAGYKIEKAKHDPLCTGGDAIDVLLTKAGAPDVTLLFDPQGKYLWKEADLPFANLPTAVIDFLKANYSGWTLPATAELLTFPDGAMQYLCDLTQGNTTQEVIVAAKGTLVCAH